MDWIKQNWLKVAFLLLILTAFVVLKDFTSTEPQQALIINTATSAPYTTQILDKKCADAVATQDKYLENEKLSDTFTFEKYAISNVLTTTLANLDINSNPTARMFRTMIREDLEREGVNFAGHYTIAGVGLTGWGGNYWIVDRKNGKAFTFPYMPYLLDYRKDSNLLIMNSKPIIKEALAEAYQYNGPCSDIGGQGILYSDLRPFYFLWENNQLKLLGPTHIKPDINEYWTKSELWKEISTQHKN